MRQYIEPMIPQPDDTAMPRVHAGPGGRAAGRLAAAARHALAGWRAGAGSRCAVCRSWCRDGLCACCAARFAFERERCAACALALPLSATVTEAGQSRCLHCLRTPPPWSRATAAVDYGYPWDRLLAEFKFHQRLDHAGVLLRPLVDRLRREATGGVRVVAVPLARERLRERGYNQSWELARRLARTLALEARPDALFRVRDTRHQLGLHRTARAANLRGAFVVAPHRAAWVRGASIALVDDVLTTGATAQAAAHALLAAGARDVQVWAVARTPE
jgi:ComF family protein